MMRSRHQNLEPPADGIDPDNYGPIILATCWLVEVLSGIIICLRVYCKLKRRPLLFQTANVIVTTVNVSLGGGQHIYRLDPAVIPILGLTGNVAGTLSIIAALLSKASFGFTLIRLTNGAIKWCIYVLLVTMNIFLAMSAVFIWVRCTPVARTCRHEVRGACWAPIVNTSYGLFSGVYSAFVDFTLSFLRWPLIWNLQIRLRENLGVVVAMSMGVFAGLGAIAKDYKSEIVIWGTVETAVTIIAASIPFLRILVVESRPLRECRPQTPKFMFPREVSVEHEIAMDKDSAEWEQFQEITNPGRVVC
ncbi:hypothetical protein B0T14DRAFT_568003 [Immersiella caudata]|uniref:Rhodopsin domain-containing protein n=1 Tax=Immersiella caudata TaxID=314043 RepID=A0AA39WJD8_9PEZI|nr:hypothetical protein B0T14DRAFT_568003 [Immersiella caudata]